MKSLWLNKKDNDNLIVFFNGWAMNETAISHLECKNNDVLMFYDYRTLEVDCDIENFDFSQYENKFLVSWSMGVYMSNLFYDELKYFNKKVAVNGTFFPINNDYAIPEKIYDLTLNNFNETSCKKFLRRMFVNKEMNFNFDRTTQELKDELIKIKQYAEQPLRQTLKYDKAVISLNDKIIPAKNQTNFWTKQKGVDVININGGHCPFYDFQSWDELIK